jgi:DNA-binding transcriptional ArsR family regulator
MKSSLKELEKIFKALGNRRRLAIIRFLNRQGEQSVANIARKIKLSFTSTSKHLLALYRSDILDRRQESLSVYYRLQDRLPEAMERVLVNISNSRE